MGGLCFGGEWLLYGENGSKGGHHETLLVILVLLGCVLPVPAFADDGIENKPLPVQINELAGKIMVTNFKPLALNVEAASEKEALVAIASHVRAYLNDCKVCCLLSRCLEVVKVPTNGEYELIKLWAKEFQVTQITSNRVRISCTLNTAQLTQVALYNMWPLYMKAFS